ncbi:uncharacterized protein LOC131006604 isoform X3 [Salvia miltiorrhiza]|uniref:uncharacterized protein LOC131006604 isoform X3 n=1 Tax=Salvia miltiorrhiza TaxID=226208 RepID=UPI0025AD5D88|nr:uncharacterized protein LOC131006604 isoform X3 [Salvia miltiorrhiza]XP_057789750.1 uncharacterized protein LOC131006604 isoform X3 [Salvia miltiorrhiza]
MLQWMGGSRRKVTTKQYFEQRKRQQQQTAGLESYSDGKRSCTLQSDYSRSLDILSLENVSAVAQGYNTSTTIASDNLENDDFTLNDQDAFPSQVILTSDCISVDQSEINERSPPSYVTEAEYPKKVSVHLQNNDENLVGNFSELDSFKLSVSHQISVIDLLGDGTNTNAEENSLREQEAHVAFSVEGLGQVETETPVHSPKIPGRSFLNCYSPPKKASRVPITSKHLNYGFHDLGSRPDVLMQDIAFSPCDSTIDQPFCTRDLMNAAGDLKQNFLNFRRPSMYDWNCSNVQRDLGNDELLYNNRGSRRRIWDDDGFDDLGLGEHESFCTNFDERDVGFDDYFHPKNLWKQDLGVEGWDLYKKRSSIKRLETFNVKESPGPYAKHIIMEDVHGTRISDNRWHSGIEINNDVKDNNSVSEDSRERSLLRFKICLLACTHCLSFYSEMIRILLTYSEIMTAKNHALPLQ